MVGALLLAVWFTVDVFEVVLGKQWTRERLPGWWFWAFLVAGLGGFHVAARASTGDLHGARRELSALGLTLVAALVWFVVATAVVVNFHVATAGHK
jgi:hypothetical protein